jgi:rhomboid protease GluP
VGLNVLVFVAMVVAGVSFSDPDARQILRWGADFGPLTLHGEWWRLGTSMFLHFGFLHLAFNMWALLNLGLVAEGLFGSRRFLAVYVLSGLGGSLASVFVHPMVVGGGASGAIFGVAGGLIVALRAQRGATVRPGGRFMSSLVMFVLYNLFFGFATPGIDNIAHLGGLVTGAAFCAALALWPALSLARLVAGFTLALAIGAFEVQRVRAPVVAEFLEPEPRAALPDHGVLLLPPARHVVAPPDVGPEVVRLERLVAQRPDSMGAYTALATAYLEESRPDEAVAILDRARGRWPNDVGVLTTLGTAYLNLRRLDEAIAAFGRVAQIDSSNADARYNLADAYLLRGEVFAATGRSDQARADLERVLLMRPDSQLVATARDQLRSLPKR